MGSDQPPRKPYEAVSAAANEGKVTSAELLKGRQQLEIIHAGETYRLRVTKAGKLILTK